MNQNKRLNSLLILLIVFLGCNLLRSQNMTRLGFNAGMNISSLDEGRYADYDHFYPGTGYFIGLTADKSFGNSWELNFELNLIRRIYKEKYLDETGPILDYNISDYRVKSASLQLPILINYAIDRLSIQTGMYGEVFIDRSFSGSAEQISVDQLLFDKNFNAGLIFGGHYDFYNLEIGMRKMIGLFNQEEIMVMVDGIHENISLYKTDDLQFYVKYLF